VPVKDLETIHGIHAVSVVLARAPARVQWLGVLAGRRDERLRQVLELAVAADVEVRELSRPDLDRAAGGEAHQGVIARVQALGTVGEDYLFGDGLAALEESALLLILDGVTDPHNLGACLRSAEAFGAQALIAPRDNAAPLNATARKVASGAAELVPVVSVANLARTMRRLQEAGIWIVGAAGEAGQRIWSVDLRGPVAIAMGAEGRGLRRLTREHCDFLVSIPMAGQVSSLNVSVAAGICLYEARRQRTG
jgi:23S rRNA (guanosine2251-2'-O)-methyltransferase